MQCALRVAPEHFAVPTVIKNAIGWVALINKKKMIQLHGTYSPWAYGFNYVVNIVSEESLILFLLFVITLFVITCLATVTQRA
jgi:hypothetical protein